MNTASQTAYPTDERRWNAVLERAPRAEAAFVYAVRTTGVYCRPTCASRLPNRENIAFFATHEEAELAGFRACRKCRPESVVLPSSGLRPIVRLRGFATSVRALSFLYRRARAAIRRFDRDTGCGRG